MCFVISRFLIIRSLQSCWGFLGFFYYYYLFVCLFVFVFLFFFGGGGGHGYAMKAQLSYHVQNYVEVTLSKFDGTIAKLLLFFSRICHDSMCKIMLKQVYLKFDGTKTKFPSNSPNSHISECICSISHNVPFRTEMCTFLFWMKHCGIWNRWILGFVKLVYWNTMQ